MWHYVLPGQFLFLLVFFADIYDLEDVVVGVESGGPDVDVSVLLSKEVCCQALHLLGPGGAPHQALPVGSDLVHNLADLGLETHVQHSVTIKETLNCDCTVV